MRGQAFARAISQIGKLSESEGESIVIVTEGPDQVCAQCPELGDNRCESPLGNEEKVRIWDSKIREGLGLSYGERITIKELLDLIEEKAPLGFCKERCPWKVFCGVFGD